MAANRTSIVSRSSPLIAALFPLILAVLLVIQAPRRYHGSIVSFVSSNRSAVQIIVQVVSHSLGLLQIYSVQTSQKFAVRLRLFRTSTSLENVGFWMAVASGKLETSLSIRHLAVSSALIAVCVIPGALWAGALTPLSSPGVLTQQSTTVLVPVYSQASTTTWDAEFQMRGNELWNLVSECRGAGLLTNCPVPALQGLLLSAAGSASVSGDLPRQHAKFDSPQWTYSGRSYGMGASIGLPGWTDAEQHSLRAISYADYGYEAAVTCSYNNSAAYSLQLLTDASLGPTSIAVYMAAGYLPNSFNDGIGDGTGEAYSVASSSSNYQDILAWSARAIGGQSYVSIASGIGKYTAFNRTQCEITFTASAFNITVNMTSKAIEVSPTGTPTAVDALLHNVTITTNAINSLNLLSRMSGTLYSSILGDALTRNLATIVGDSATVGNDPSAAALNALQDSFTAMLDDILVAYGAAQVSLANDTKSVPAVGRGPLIAIGDVLYIYIVLGMSGALLLYHLFNTTRFRFWTQLQPFDPFDAKSLIAAASAGGSGIARNLEDRSAATDSGSTHRVWNGQADEKVLRAARVTFRAPDGEHRLPSIASASEGLIDWNVDEATYPGVTSRHKPASVASGDSWLLGRTAGETTAYRQL